jgi:hypothetical protein
MGPIITELSASVSMAQSVQWILLRTGRADENGFFYFPFFHTNTQQSKLRIYQVTLYSASHLRVAPENVDLQKEQKYNTLACHTCNEVRFCVLGIRKKGSW